MTQAGGTGSRSKNLVLTAMIFAVSMTFIDQTIVSIAVPEIQKELGLPIKFIGLGEQPDDLQPFDAKQFAQALFEE